MRQPKIGLALGSGGARGFAHLGVIKVLLDHNIPIDYIAGSSMGALIGSFYGAGHGIERLYNLAIAFQRKYYLDFTVPKMGFIAGNRVKELIRIFTHGKNIEELNIPLAIVATDLLKGERVVFREGSVTDAVRASISIPGIFVPEKKDDKILVDGGVIDRLPVSVARDMGADLIIAVDVNEGKMIEEISTIFDVIMQSIDLMQDELVKYVVNDSDITIKPKVGVFSARAFTNIEEIIKMGEDETKNMLPAIKEMIQKWKESNGE
ncbi:patatin-like phospholipase family protein [Bacillus sp. AK128]